MIQGHIKPIWNINDFKSLQYNNPVANTERVFENYLHSGHSDQALNIRNYHEPNPMPDCVEKIKQDFAKNYDKVSIAVNLFLPGCYVPMHSDDYKAYKRVHNVTKEKVIRFIVMLEDHVPGQISCVEDYCITHWQAGDYVAWENNQTHAFYNMSMENRYALQITTVESQNEY